MIFFCAIEEFNPGCIENLSGFAGTASNNLFLLDSGPWYRVYILGELDYKIKQELLCHYEKEKFISVPMKPVDVK